MDGPSQEILEERSKLTERVEHVEEFLDKAEGAFLMAPDPKSAKLRLYEAAFYQIAFWQLVAQETRMSVFNPEDMDLTQKNLVHLTIGLDSVRKYGDWRGLKELIGVQLVNRDITDVNARKMGLPIDLKIDGIIVFKQKATSTMNPSEDDLDWEDMWSKFVVNKLKQVPDHSEPFEHPDIEELKSQVS